MDATGRVAVVTGASGEGLGLEIVRGIAQQGCDKVKVVLTARNINSGEEAVRLLNQDPEGLSNVVFHQLDITDLASINKFVEWIRDNSGGLDILVNNAGIFDVTGAAIETNYYGTKRVTEALLGFMKPGARIVNVSSGSGRLDLLADETWKRKLLDSESLTEEVVEQFVKEYLDKLSTGRGDEMISGHMAVYSVSKMALNAYSQVLAKRLEEKGIIVTCMCPGHTSTKLTMRTGHPAAVGADTAVWLATAPAADISTGKFYIKRKSVESLLEIPCVSGEKVYRSLDEWMCFLQKLREMAKDIKE